LQTAATNHDVTDFSPARVALWGLFSRRVRWSLSLRGWLTLLVCCVGLSAVVLFGVHSFLAITHPVESNTLVVEGWIPDPVFNDVVAEVKLRGYQHVLTTGGPINWDVAASSGGTYAGYGATRLKESGVAPNIVVAVPCKSRDWERTFQAGLAVHDYITTNHLSSRGLNVITVGAHARRTRLLYERALQGKIPVGIIALQPDGYDPKHWWRTSTGIREVISETAAYIYCRLVPRAFTEP
jgi:hypothetical protein